MDKENRLTAVRGEEFGGWVGRVKGIEQRKNKRMPHGHRQQYGDCTCHVFIAQLSMAGYGGVLKRRKQFHFQELDQNWNMYKGIGVRMLIATLFVMA